MLNRLFNRDRQVKRSKRSSRECKKGDCDLITAPSED